ncbi:MAG: hypothetical protein Fues2KO_46940 [Fuerstiella sp.]
MKYSNELLGVSTDCDSGVVKIHLQPTAWEYSPKVLQFVNLGIFAKLGIRLGLVMPGDDLEHEFLRKWRIASPFYTTSRVRLNRYAQGGECIQDDGSIFVGSHAGDGFIEVTSSDDMIRWKDGPIELEEVGTAVISGHDFPSLWNYTAQSPVNELDELIEQITPWSLTHDFRELYE